MGTPEHRSAIELRGAGAPGGRVSAAWASPAGAVAALVLAPGAGAPMDHPFLVGFARGMNEAGVGTLRFNFPYAEEGRRSPDPPGVLMAAWRAAFEAARERFPGLPVLAGGKSLGGRIASMCVAEGMAAAGLVFLGYPLHPPGRPERLRDEHLDGIRVPMLFLQGTRDPFARPELLAAVLERLGGRASHVAVEGGDHSFRVRGVRADDGEIGASLAALAAPFVRRVAGVA
ncbi:MAG TPA: alpha/beta family hydrolase [Actinomycetota bacterium]|nr:alpha/beta family hydrolase [Actinomycetota bacterium]